MVFTVANTTAFFTIADKISTQGEGIVMAEDLGGFEDTHWLQVSMNLRNPASIPDPDNAALQVQPQNFTLGAKSLNRLKALAAMVRYYDSICRPMTAANMQYTVGKFFVKL